MTFVSWHVLHGHAHFRPWCSWIWSQTWNHNTTEQLEFHCFSMSWRLQQYENWHQLLWWCSDTEKVLHLKKKERRFVTWLFYLLKCHILAEGNTLQVRTFDKMSQTAKCFSTIHASFLHHYRSHLSLFSSPSLM